MPSAMPPSLFLQPNIPGPDKQSPVLSFSNNNGTPKPRRVVASPKQGALATNGGKKHHAFDPTDVPYPVSYDRKIVSLDILDHLFVLHARKNNVTWVDFKDGTPKRSLDIGCGTGDWIMDAAKQWKDCHFVGFDIVSVQPSPALLQKMGIADRVKWVHGNFLKEKLPFEDNFFDHVHVYRIGWGVAEDMWDGLFEEIARVLRPGGAIEIGEEDIIFPTLPMSYTIKPKPRPSTPHRPSLTLSPPQSPVEKPESMHAHALLESLYYGVFESRKINCRPTSIIPHYLNIHFRHVTSTPNVELPMPPPPVSRQQLRRVPSDSTTRPDAMKIPKPEKPSDFALTPSSSTSSLAEQLQQQQQQQTPPTTEASSLRSRYSEIALGIAMTEASKLPQVVSGSFEPVDPLSNVTLLPPVSIDLNNRNLAIHLNSAFLRILACKEAMWEELSRRLHERNSGGPDELVQFGWDDVEDVPLHNHTHGSPERTMTQELEIARTRFDEMTLRFERDMRHRTALADAIESNLGWKKPPPEPLSKHERTRQKELDQAIAAALRVEPEELEQAQVSRSFKGFIGFKEGRRR